MDSFGPGLDVVNTIPGRYANITTGFKKKNARSMNVAVCIVQKNGTL
jgi:hypothetical protein